MERERIKLPQMLEYLRSKRKAVLIDNRTGKLDDIAAEYEEDMILAIMEVVREVDAQYLSTAERLINMGYVERKPIK